MQGPGLAIALPEITVVADFLPFDLGGSDIILGIQWLRTLGDMTVNWQELWMQFWVDDRLVKITGDPTLSKSLVSGKTLCKMLQQEVEGFWVQLASAEETGRSPTIPREIHAILEGFPDVFNMPSGLPPNRSHEHGINLQEGTSPVNVRPYRYPHAQKDEIEKLVGEMLRAGIIQQSTSPF